MVLFDIDLTSTDREFSVLAPGLLECLERSRQEVRVRVLPPAEAQTISSPPPPPPQTPPPKGKEIETVTVYSQVSPDLIVTSHHLPFSEGLTLLLCQE
jgi:hypothetical protein